MNLKKESQGEQQSADSFLVFPKQGVKPPSNVIEELLQQAEEGEDRERIERSAHDDQLVEVAFRMHDGKLVATDGCVLFAYLPTAKETHLWFLIQARYQTTPARDNIPTDSAWNRWLIEETANCLPFVLSQIKEAGLLLEIYFQGFDGIWYATKPLDRLPPDKFEQLLKGLGVEDKPRRIAFNPKFDEQRLRELRRGQRSTRDLEVMDFHLAGLDHFLEKLLRLPAAGGGELALVLWKLLLLHMLASYKYYDGLPDFFRGRYRYQYRTEHLELFVSHFTGQLRTAPWLPGRDGQLHRPSQMSVSELPQDFERNDVLARVLNMKPETVVSWARERGLDPSALDYLLDEQKFEQFKRWVEEQGKKPTGSSESVDGGGHRGGGEGTGGHGGGSGGGEGTAHRELKEQLARNPEILEPGMRLYRQEPQLQSHYRPDLILQDKDGRYGAVEVESDFPGDNDTGVWQAVAYKHVLAAELNLPCDQVRGFLVAPRIPDILRQKCRELGVEPFELGEGPSAEGDPPEST